MISKEKLKEMIVGIRELNGLLTLGHIPRNYIYSARRMYEIYYSGKDKIEVGKYFENGAESILIKNENLDEIVDKIYVLLIDDIGKQIGEAIDIMKLHDNELKYFDREPEQFKKFQEIVLKLKDEQSI